ncbi:uncharacterized protein LOC132677675 [Panthera onca]
MRRRARQGSPSPRRPPDAPGAARAQRAARPRPRRQESGAAPAPPRARAQRPPRDGTLSPHPHVWLRNVWLAGRHSAGRGRVFPRQVPSSPRPFPGRRPRAAAGPPRFPGLELPARAFPGPGPPALERRGPGTVLDPLTRAERKRHSSVVPKTPQCLGFAGKWLPLCKWIGLASLHLPCLLFFQGKNISRESSRPSLPMQPGFLYLANAKHRPCLQISSRESKGLSRMNFLSASPSDYTPMFVSTCLPAATSLHGPLQPRALGISSAFVSRTAQTVCNLSLGLSVSHHSDSEFSWIQESNK